jgi:hypothetical protein
MNTATITDTLILRLHRILEPAASSVRLEDFGMTRISARAGVPALPAARPRSPVALSALCLALPIVAVAQTSDRIGEMEQGAEGSHLALGAAFLYTDNALLTARDGTSDTIRGLVTDFGIVSSPARRLRGSATGSLAYYSYDQSSYLDETVGGASAMGALDIVQEHLSWVASGTFGQVRVNSAAPVTSLNRQDYVLIDTGPQFRMQFDQQRTSLQLDGRYERADFEISASDNESWLVQLAAERALSERSQLTLTAVNRHTWFDSSLPTLSAFDRREIVAGWLIQGRRTEIQLEGGYSQVEGVIANDGPLLRATVNRRLSTRMSVELHARSQLVSAADALRFEQSASGAGRNTSDVSTNPEPFELQEFGAALRFDGSRIVAALDGSMGRSRYEAATTNDRNHNSIRLSMDVRATPKWSAGLSANFREERFLGALGTDYSSVDVLASTTYRFNDNLSLMAEAGLRSRSSKAVNGDYREKFAGIVVSYGIGRNYTGGSLRNVLPER